MNTATQPVRRTLHLDCPLPGFIRHRAFAHPSTAAQLDPRALLAVPASEVGGYMPDEVSRDHSKRMHYAAYRMHAARTRRDLHKWQQTYLELRNRIVVGNRKLAYRAVRAFARDHQLAEDLAAECHVILIHAVVAFNPWIGIRFSTYAYTCLLRALSRQGKRAAKSVVGRAISLDYFLESEPPAAENVAAPTNHTHRLDEYLRADHPLLSEREKMVILRRFNLNEQSENTTLEQVGREMGLSKERVRQVQAAAIDKLRMALTVVGPE